MSCSKFEWEVDEDQKLVERLQDLERLKNQIKNVINSEVKLKDTLTKMKKASKDLEFQCSAVRSAGTKRFTPAVTRAGQFVHDVSNISFEGLKEVYEPGLFAPLRVIDHDLEQIDQQKKVFIKHKKALVSKQKKLSKREKATKPKERKVSDARIEEEDAEFQHGESKRLLENMIDTFYEKLDGSMADRILGIGSVGATHFRKIAFVKGMEVPETSSQQERQAPVEAERESKHETQLENPPLQPEPEPQDQSIEPAVVAPYSPQNPPGAEVEEESKVPVSHPDSPQVTEDPLEQDEPESSVSREPSAQSQLESSSEEEDSVEKSVSASDDAGLKELDQEKDIQEESSFGDQILNEEADPSKEELDKGLENGEKELNQLGSDVQAPEVQ